MNDTSI